MFKKIIFILIIFSFLYSCGGTWDSVKRGLTGQNANSTDEFLVEKKDPLILPPNFEDLPEPSKSVNENEDEIESFEKTLGALSTGSETDESQSTGSEQSILEKIRSQ